MANIKAGIIGAIATVVILMVELILFPIALTFLTQLNDSTWISTSDRTTITKVPTLMVVIVLFTALGGMIGSIYLGIKG